MRRPAIVAPCIAFRWESVMAKPTRRSSTRWRTVTGLILVLAAAAVPAAAQTIRSTLTGTVTDPNNAVVPGVAITVTNVATNISTTARTNSEGLYTFTALTPGEYAIAVEQKGFKRFVQSGIVLQIAQATRLDIPLEVGAGDRRSLGHAEAPLVHSTSSELGQVIDYKQIQSLPLNGRLFQQLVTLTPGAIPRGFADFAENPAAAGARSFVHHSVNGMPWSGNNYLLDGVANNEPLNAFINVTPPLEAIQEFKVQTNNPSAEFGVFGGAVVNLTIRSGTNRYQRLGVRVLSRRLAELPEFLRRHQGAVQLAPVRRHLRRADSPEQGLLLRGLSGPAAGSGPHVPVHGADRRDADRQPERDQQRHLPSDHRRADRGQRDPGQPDQPDRAAASPPSGRCPTCPVSSTTTSRTTCRPTISTRSTFAATSTSGREARSSSGSRARTGTSSSRRPATSSWKGATPPTSGNYNAVVGHTYTISSSKLNELRVGVNKYDLAQVGSDFGIDKNNELGIPNGNIDGHPYTSGIADFNIPGLSPHRLAGVHQFGPHRQHRPALRHAVVAREPALAEVRRRLPAHHAPR